LRALFSFTVHLFGNVPEQVPPPRDPFSGGLWHLA